MLSEQSVPVRAPRLTADTAAGLLESPTRDRAFGPARTDPEPAPPNPTDRTAPGPAALASDTYHVLALRARFADDSAETGAHRAALLGEELRNRCGAGIVADLAADGGTVLVPAAGLDATDLDAAVAAAGRAAGLALLVAAVRADPAQLRTAHEHARELLELAEALGRDAGTYRFDDLALEYQLTRPGWARDRLAATIAPLRPELTATLTHFLRHNGDAVATARAMDLPQVSVTARLADIARLTGLEPRLPTDLWRLHSALIAHTGSRAGTGTLTPDRT